MANPDPREEFWIIVVYSPLLVLIGFVLLLASPFLLYYQLLKSGREKAKAFKRNHEMMAKYKYVVSQDPKDIRIGQRDYTVGDSLPEKTFRDSFGGGKP